MRVTGTSGTTSVPTRGAREKRARRRAAGAIQGCRSQSRRPTVSLVRMTILASGITFDGVCFTCFRDWHGTPAARSRSLKSARLREESVSLRSACKRRKPFVLRATDNRSRNASHMVRIVGRLEVANLASRLDYATPIGPYGDIVAGLASAGLPVAGRHGPAKRAGTTLRRRPKQSLAGYTPRKNRCGIRSSNEKSNLSRDGRPFWIGCVTYRSFRTIKGRGTPFWDRRGAEPFHREGPSP